jgi:hypothetical protein
MNAITKLEAAIILAGTISVCSMSTNASSWWESDDYYDRWHGGPWYGGGYPGYGWGGYRGYGGYPGYGWGGHPGYHQSKTIIVIPQGSDNRANEPAPEPRLPK